MKSLLPGGLGLPNPQPAGEDPVQMTTEGGSGSSQLFSLAPLIRLIGSYSQCGSEYLSEKEMTKIDGTVMK